MFHPVPWPQQNDTGGLQEEHAKVAIAALGDTPEDRSITCRYLLWDQAKPSSKIATTCEGSSIADRGDDGARDDRTYAWYRHQMPTRLCVLGERFDFATHNLDAIVEVTPNLELDPLGCEPSAVIGHLRVGQGCPVMHGVTSGAVASP